VSNSTQNRRYQEVDENKLSEDSEVESEKVKKKPAKAVVFGKSKDKNSKCFSCCINLPT
jgi:hypothetical protein